MTKPHENLPMVGQQSQAIVANWRMPLTVILAGVALLVTATALKAFRETFDAESFPEALAIKLDVLPILFPIHMFTGGLALLLVPFTLLLRGTAWHRWAGRVAAVDVLLAGATAIPVALSYPVTPWAAAGFSTQGMLWLALLALGFWNIRRGNVAAHQRVMLLMAAVTSGAVFFRVYLALWAGFGSHAYFKTFYSCDAWVAWGLPFLAMFAFTMKKGRAWRPFSSLARLN
jgi:uncharacterized membrane protein